VPSIIARRLVDDFRHLQESPSFHDASKPTIEEPIGLDLEKIAAVGEPDFSCITHNGVLTEKGRSAHAVDRYVFQIFGARGLVLFELVRAHR
jgi:hypothetical protein